MEDFNKISIRERYKKLIRRKTKFEQFLIDSEDIILEVL